MPITDRLLDCGLCYEEDGEEVHPHPECKLGDTAEPACALTVADLQAALALLPSDMLVVLAKDGEGNGFSPLSEAESAMYAADSTWSGERYMTEEQRQATGEPDEYSPAPADAVPALFLWPVN